MFYEPRCSARTSARGTPRASRTMDSMFTGASAFDQDIGACVDAGVTTMEGMFYWASSFNQDIGCVMWTTNTGDWDSVRGAASWSTGQSA